MTDAAYNFISLARQLVSYENYKTALNMYIYAFNAEPLIKEQLEAEFRDILLKRNEELASVDNRSEIFANFEKSINMFPGNVDLLNDIGRYLYKYKYFSEALCHFEKALNIDNSLAIIEKNLNSAKSVLFPRCKFRVLNDKARNIAYRAAIRRCINAATDSVLNIDAGTGLLALYTQECNPIAISACEGSVTMARLAECVMQENNAQEVIIVNKAPFFINQEDIYGYKSVLITDTIDAGIFGEFILQMICYAWENLLCPASKVIPGKAEYFIVGVNCDDLNKKYKLCQNIKNILNVSNMNIHTTTYYSEAYYSEDVDLYDDVKYVSDPQSVFTVDFNNYYDVRQKIYQREPYNVSLTANEDTEINLIIGWFNLYLTEDIMLTTNPRSENRITAWQQAVFFDVLPRQVRRSESISISFSTYGGRLATVRDESIPISRISPDALTYLNDTEYINLIQRSVGAVCIHLGQTICMEQVEIIDLSPFPIFGILMMKRGAHSLICHAKSGYDAEFIHEVLVANEIPSRKVSILDSELLAIEDFRDKKFHVIFTNVIDFYGDIDSVKNRLSQHLKQSCLAPGGICLPSSITVMGRLISSDFLQKNNSIVDDNVGYSIAKHLNRYQVSQLLELDIARLEYEPLSEVFEVASSEDVSCNVIKVSVLYDGLCNGILCWYKIELLPDWPVIYTDRLNSFVRGMAFINNSMIKVFKDDEANILRCADIDGSYKLVLDIEP